MDNKEELKLLVDLHKTTQRQGPGGDDQTRLAISLSGLRASPDLRIADIGSGSGAASLVLADVLQAHVTAVDVVPSFLNALQSQASKLGLSDRIDAVEGDMTDLPFPHEKEEGQLFDAIWSEGAVYNIGFEKGIAEWRRYLKPRGILAVSELTWFTKTRPAALDVYWTQEYSEVDTASRKIALLEQHGYKLLGYFPLSQDCWLENYYNQIPFDEFLERNNHSEAARQLVDAETKEIDFYKEYSDYYGYGYYIAQRVD